MTAKDDVARLEAEFFAYVPEWEPAEALWERDFGKRSREPIIQYGSAEYRSPTLDGRYLIPAWLAGDATVPGYEAFTARVAREPAALDALRSIAEADAKHATLRDARDDAAMALRYERESASRALEAQRKATVDARRRAGASGVDL